LIRIKAQAENGIVIANSISKRADLSSPNSTDHHVLGICDSSEPSARRCSGTPDIPTLL